MAKNHIQLDQVLISSNASMFEKIYENRSVNRASRKIGVDAGHLSRVVKRLEATLGSPLFSRHKNGLTPTPLADQLYALLTDMRANLARNIEPQSNTRMRIGFHPIIGFGHMGPELTETIVRENFSPEFVLSSSDKIIELLKARELDFGIVHGSVKMPGMIVRQIESLGSILVSRDGKLKENLLVHSDSAFATSTIANVPATNRWVLADHFLISNMVANNNELMGILPSTIVSANPRLKVIRWFRDRSKVTAVTWPGSPGVKLLKALQKQ